MAFDHKVIAKHEIIIRFFGGWPSFDDFEVISMLLMRPDKQNDYAALTVTFACPIGARKSEGCVFVMKFSGLEDLKLNGFNHQNAINGLNISSRWSSALNREVLQVEIVQGVGVGGEFQCDGIEVLSLEAVTSL